MEVYMILDSYGLFLDDDLSHKSTSALVNNIDNNKTIRIENTNILGEDLSYIISKECLSFQSLR